MTEENRKNTRQPYILIEELNQDENAPSFEDILYSEKFKSLLIKILTS